MKIGAIIQARTSSSRLPQKVLKPLPYNGDTTVLQHVIRRTAKAELIDEVIVATTENPEDDEIIEIAIKENAKHYRGSLENVLERYYKAAAENNLDIIIRITSDNPCIDPEIIDKVINSHIESNADYTSNSLKKLVPLGIGVEVINFNALNESYKNATKKYEKEHVTPYIYKSHPKKFKINHYENHKDNSDIRITLDTPQDYALLSIIYEELYEKDKYFKLKDILDLIDEKPYLKDINSKIIQKKVCNGLNEELNEAINLCDNFDLPLASEYIKKNSH